jgi:hypothetical protein
MQFAKVCNWQRIHSPLYSAKKEGIDIHEQRFALGMMDE